MGQDDLIMAFFPCTRFEAQILLSFRGESYQDRKLNDIEKLKKDLRLHSELSSNYELITKLSIISLERKIPMIFENPYCTQHYLTRYWCLKPSVIDKDRTLDGDYFKKPTQYWFYNIEPKNNFVFEPIDYVPTQTIDNASINGMSRTTSRSMIHPQYVSRFIKKYIIDYQTDYEKLMEGNI